MKRSGTDDLARRPASAGRTGAQPAALDVPGGAQPPASAGRTGAQPAALDAPSGAQPPASAGRTGAQPAALDVPGGAHPAGLDVRSDDFLAGFDALAQAVRRARGTNGADGGLTLSQ